jgi:hypothetical protein
MCNGAKHPSGCECGFGPPYPGKIELVKTEAWVDEATDSEESFKRALNDLSIKGSTFSSFVRQYNSIQHLQEPKETIRQKINDLVNKLEYREEESRYELVNVPLFKLHSPPVRRAQVTYRESALPEKERGWLVKVFGIGMGPTKTFRVVYEPNFVSEKGECLQIHVPLVLHIRKIGVYKLGVFQSHGIRAEIENVKEESTLRKRGCEKLPKDLCANKLLLGTCDTKGYALSTHTATQLETFKLSLPFNVARTVEMHFVEVFGKTFDALADIKHQSQLELEFQLPGNHDYNLSFNSSGLHWAI